MDYLVEKTEDQNVLRLSGDWTVSRAAELKDILINLLLEYEPFQLDMTDVSSMDLSCLQVLRSAYLTYEKNGNELILIGDPPDEIQKFIGETGFHKHDWLLGYR